MFQNEAFLISSSALLHLDRSNMPLNIVRASKFRHVFGTAAKPDASYNNVKISKLPWESQMSSVNGKFLAVVLESQGGGAFMVMALNKVGE